MEIASLMKVSGKSFFILIFNFTELINAVGISNTYLFFLSERIFLARTN